MLYYTMMHCSFQFTTIDMSVYRLIISYQLESYMHELFGNNQSINFNITRLNLFYHIDAQKEKHNTFKRIIIYFQHWITFRNTFTCIHILFKCVNTNIVFVSVLGPSIHFI